MVKKSKLKRIIPLIFTQVDVLEIGLKSMDPILFDLYFTSLV